LHCHEARCQVLHCHICRLDTASVARASVGWR
jgi:hypothetical protein